MLLGTYINYTIFIPIVDEALQEVTLEQRFDAYYKEAENLAHEIKPQSSNELTTDLSERLLNIPTDRTYRTHEQLKTIEKLKAKDSWLADGPKNQPL